MVTRDVVIRDARQHVTTWRHSLVQLVELDVTWILNLQHGRVLQTVERRRQRRPLDVTVVDVGNLVMTGVSEEQQLAADVTRQTIGNGICVEMP